MNNFIGTLRTTFPILEQLWLVYCETLVNAGFSLLNRVDEQMRILDLYLTRLYQPEIDALIHRLPELEEINLDGAENITDIGVIALFST